MAIREVPVGAMSFEPIHESIVAVAPAATYQKRIARALELARKRGLTHLLVYGDREHFANIHYFTGYDPRFEESLLVLSEAARPAILVGNEGYAYSALIPYEIDRILYQTLSLPDQPRGEANRDVLPAAIKKLGVTWSSRVGVVGWKYFVEEDGREHDRMIDLPCFMIEALCEFVPRERIENATDLMIHPEHGMRTELDVDEMAVLELAGTKSSRSVREVLSHLAPGMSEIEALVLPAASTETPSWPTRTSTSPWRAWRWASRARAAPASSSAACATSASATARPWWRGPASTRATSGTSPRSGPTPSSGSTTPTSSSSRCGTRCLDIRGHRQGDGRGDPEADPRVRRPQLRLEPRPPHPQRRVDLQHLHREARVPGP